MNDQRFLSRRRLLGATAAAALTAALGTPLLAAAARAPKTGGAPVRWVPGMELYTLGLTPKDDIAAAFKALAALGYREIEYSGPYDRPAAELRRAADAAGLVSPAAHAVPRTVPGAWSFEETDRFIADLKTLGARYGVVPIPLLPDRIYNVILHPPAGWNMDTASRLFATLDADDWKRTADFLNEKARVLDKAGLRLAYHNHGMDFAPLAGGGNGFHILIERTDPKLVHFELDIGWAVAAGQALPPLFHALGDRLKLLHLKDTKRLAKSVMDLASTDAGTGMVKWNEVVELVRKSRIEHMFVEQEEPFPTTPMDAARIDYEFLTKLFAGTATTRGSRS